MIDPEVKWIDWTEEAPKNDGSPELFTITAGIGRRGIEAADNFQLVCCNLQWIQNHLKYEEGFWPRGMIVLNKIDTDHITLVLESLVNQFQNSSSWEEFAERLNRYLLWEYEDIDDYQGTPKIPPLS